LLHDLEKWLDKFQLEFEESGDEWISFLCPFHEDSNPSCFLNTETHVFHCKTCGASGDVYKLLAAQAGSSRDAVVKMISGKQKTLPQDVVHAMHEKLLKNKSLLKKLEEDKGINLATVKARFLGWDGERITIPIFDHNKEVVNIRKWSPKKVKYKIVNHSGYGGARLYPIEALEHKEVIITEGELKALLLQQLGFKNALGPTGGASTWQKDWNKLFKDKIVYIIYDIDKPGKSGTQRVAAAIYGVAKKVYPIMLPMNIKEFPTGDVTDYVATLGHGRNDIQELMNNASEWEPIEVLSFDTEVEEPERVTLAESSDAKYFHKSVCVEVVASAKDVAPYIVPSEFEITCAKDKDVCGLCPVNASSEMKTQVKISNKHPVLLELIDIKVDDVRKVLKKVARIPRICEEWQFEIETTVNVEEVRLIPQLSIGSTDSSHVVRRAFYVGNDMESNVTYEIVALALPEPKTQYATLLIYEATPSVDSLSVFKLDRDLSVFQPERWTLDSVRDKLKDIYSDLSANVTRIYERQNLHFVIDLAYHSPLYLRFQGQVIKGWVEALVLGDSGQGKSETTGKLKDFYGLGEKIDAKGASVAGLVGGLQETGKRWFVSWGVITLNDRRLVILEEVKGLAPDVIAKLTEVRSSGVAEVSKVEKARTNARTRLIWISNPRSDRRLLSYNFGVEAIKELIGTLEDIRRFDVAIIVTSGEVSRKVVNLSEDERPRHEHVYKRELCRDLILWTWSRSVDQVHFEKKATQAILEESSLLGKKYVANIPLIEPADQRLKLARLSAALAARTYSTEGDGVLVRPCHVEYISMALDQIYSQATFGYADYSRMIQTENELRDPDQVKDRVRALPFARDVVRAMLDSTSFSPFDVGDWTNYSIEESRSFIGFLVRKNALKRARRGYMKTMAFITTLKELNMEELKNEEQQLEDDEI